jgi:regulator of nucleoside diphosphate kinase
MTLPPVVISATDRERLVSLAKSTLMSDRAPPAASNLLSELARATVLAKDAVPRGVVAMGSVVEIHDDIRKTCSQVSLAYPDEASLEPKAVSVLAPLGVALIGLSEGVSIEWCTVKGDLSRITVLRVLSPPRGKTAYLKEAGEVGVLRTERQQPVCSRD